MGKLMIFDLQRFAVHDGPGIRTTIFVKGCPLRCIWCHNPESQTFAPQLRYLSARCISCKGCVRACEYGVHSFSAENKHAVDFSACTACGSCVSICPSNALQLYGKQEDTDRLLEVVLRDKKYYQASGGGLTLSGGEPMAQFPSSLELMQKAHEAGIHTCLDTCGLADPKKFLEIMPWVDLFLYDYKLSSSQKHELYTGLGNNLILKNLHLLSEKGAQIILRCPIIPDINDDEEHLRCIVQLASELEGIREVNVMAYHDVAKGKTAQIGIRYAMSDTPSMSVARKQEVMSQLKAMGLKKLAES